eukprot:15452428-Alexandrium_andersonii.AAC.1
MGGRLPHCVGSPSIAYRGPGGAHYARHGAPQAIREATYAIPEASQAYRCQDGGGPKGLFS